MTESPFRLNFTGFKPPWNKDKLIGQKPPLKPKRVWAISTRLQMAGRVRDLALFNRATANFEAATWSN